MDHRTLGLAWECDRGGQILQIVSDTIRPTEALLPGQTFIDQLDPDSRSKARNFLAEVQRYGTAFGWELNVPVQNQLVALNFSGIIQQDRLMIMAAYTRSELLELCDDLMHINNEQVNALRLALKSQAELAINPPSHEHVIYDELSRLNNELIALQRELAKKNAELEHLDQEKNHLLGMAAHDLRNPLSIIAAYSEMLVTDLQPDQAEFARAIYQSSQFMLRLINDLLDVAAIESGQVRLDLQPIDLVALIKHNLGLNQRLADRKHIALNWIAPDRLPPLMADVVKLEQVLNNLVSNAIKFSYPHSSVEVEVFLKGARVILAVHDHGQGIPDGELEKLFRAYSRTTVKSTAGESSTGLGLAIARKIVAAHDGELWVDSIFGHGTTFYMSLPLKELTLP